MGKRGFTSGGTIRKAGRQERARMPGAPRQYKKSRKKMARIAEAIVKAQAYFNAQAWDECEAYVRELEREPELRQPLLYDSLGVICERQGRIDEALHYFQKCLELDPSYAEARSRIVMILDAQPDTTPEQAQRVRDAWWRAHGAAAYDKRKPHLNDRDPERPLRVGYVSGDFQYHSAATVFERVLLHHSRDIVPFFYSTTPLDKHDHKTVAYQQYPGWREFRYADGSGPGVLLSAEWMAHKVRDDRIDILVDLSGYTSCNALPMFCHKPAPIQMTGWGYATGAGWPAMDYLMTDRVVVPEAWADRHIEKMFYLPTVIDYEPMQSLPEPNALPCLTESAVFGVFQRSLKIHDEDLEVWRQLLERLPGSRILFKSHYPEKFIAWAKSRFGAQADRVEFQGATSSYEHKCQYARVDLSLDPWPQTGGVSSCDSLWMGVPMVTLIGERVIQRTSASLLTILGLTEFITETPEQYIQTAIDWVTTRKHELAEVRAGLRARCDASPIRQGYVEAVEEGYRRVWREWCAQPLSLAAARYRLEQAS